MFSETDLLTAAGDAVFGRGEDYVRNVHGLQEQGRSATASVQAKRVYVVRLDWSGRELSGDCTCPHRAEGYFCKHLVAVGLSVLNGEDAEHEPDGLRDYVDTLSRDELAGLVLELVELEESTFRFVQARAVGAGSAAVDPQELVAAVTGALPRGFVDYRRSFDAARDVQAVLDDLEQLLQAGAADQVRPALERATTRLRSLMLNADDSAGVLGDACQRAVELHARSSTEGAPDAVKVARWLARFRSNSPGWPDVTLAMYVGAFDERALATYRNAVAKLDAATDGTGRSRRFDVDRMLLELADHDGDVDEAVRLLSRDPEHVLFGAIVNRLRTVGREPEALEWTDRAVRAGRVSARMGGQANDYWLWPPDVAIAYLRADRAADAVAVAHEAFRQQPGPESLRLVLSVGAELGLEAKERAWAQHAAIEHAGRTGEGSALVRIALAEPDLVAAWAAAQRFGAGGAWRELAEASAADFPFDAAQLYRPYLDELLRFTDTRRYPEVARTLSIMRDLYATVEEGAAFAEFLGGIREQYRRRTSLIAQLDKLGLR